MRLTILVSVPKIKNTSVKSTVLVLDNFAKAEDVKQFDSTSSFCNDLRFKTVTLACTCPQFFDFVLV